MSERCGCHAGSFENGWHETRSDACHEAELEQWRRMLANLRSTFHTSEES